MRVWSNFYHLQVFVEVLCDVVDKLYHIDIQGNEILNGKRLVSVITVILCFDKIIPKVINFQDIPFEHIVQVVSMLRLMPDVQNKRCNDWTFLDPFIHNNFRRETCEAVLSFVGQLSHQKHFSRNEWLFAIPLVHFLHRKSPFQARELDPEKIRWKDDIIGLNGIRSRTYGSNFDHV